ncbi:ABC transporter-like protein [Paenibacillus sp. FSL R7-277]|uniref:ABC transporter ATP-binding protein n=1 Tax=unclassified Paenibacillus TaxID=185978 RepID=UPI0003E26C26|nr:ATP-binding cassette domain-containing protein [Paenibacillus sp. FSL R7-277]ETT69716.1 ABC transporter-like protein [Paenibacillus sp. FSL R7-277]OMG01956.1 ABC transporter [Paenibacillus sp. FSL R7-0333]
MLTINNLVKRRGTQEILSGITFEARPGRVTGFLGPNGAGKSSTLRILLGLDHATSGSALIHGKPFAELQHPLAAVGAALDGSGAHPMRTGRAHLRWIACAAGLPRSRVEEVLDIVGLTKAAGTRVKRYSLGMGRRLGIAAALLADPEILILDEPVNGLDPEGIRWIRTFLRKRAEAGNTVLLSSHLMGELAETVDDVVIIKQGRIVADGTLQEVTGSHSTLEDAFFALTSEQAGDAW